MSRVDTLDSLLGEPTEFDAIDPELLRRRRSYKWSAYRADVLPAFVAEMDLPLAPAVSAVLQEAVAAGDCGYANDVQLAGAFAAFAARRWSWHADPARRSWCPT